jgi:hypothetical protein
MLLGKEDCSFAQILQFLLNQKLIKNTSQDKKRVVSIMRRIEIEGQKGAFAVCPLKQKNKEQY